MEERERQHKDLLRLVRLGNELSSCQIHHSTVSADYEYFSGVESETVYQ